MRVALRVRVRLFARLREVAGLDEETIELTAGGTVADVFAALVASHPGLPDDRGGVRAARNLEFCEWHEVVTDGDEIAFIPPVSGGLSSAHIELTNDPLDARHLEAAVMSPAAGAICTFTGVVRDNARGESVTHLEYEAYGGMAEAQMAVIAAEIQKRWPEARVAIAHRTGRLEIGEASVIVSVSCPHRAEAIAACHWGIDRLKESVPIWKKEFAASGASWIEGGDARPAGG